MSIGVIRKPVHSQNQINELLIKAGTNVSKNLTKIYGGQAVGGAAVAYRSSKPSKTHQKRAVKLLFW